MQLLVVQGDLNAPVDFSREHHLARTERVTTRRQNMRPQRSTLQRNCPLGQSKDVAYCNLALLLLITTLLSCGTPSLGFYTADHRISSVSRQKFSPENAWRQSRIRSATSLFESSNDDDKDTERNNNESKPSVRNPTRNDTDDSSSIDEFLDRQFFDPDDYEDEDKSIMGRFANLVKSDYALAETVYVGIIFMVMVIISQEFLRMQLYGDNYVPFTKGVAPGRLF